MFSQPSETVILVVRPVSGGKQAPVAVLREDHPVVAVIDIFGRLRTRKLLVDAVVMAVIPVLEGIPVEVRRSLVHRLKHEAKPVGTVVHIVRVARLAALHATFKQETVQLVSEGIAHVAVLVGDLGDEELGGHEYAIVHQSAGVAHAVVGAVVGRRSEVHRIGDACRMPVVPVRPRTGRPDDTLQG